MSYLANCLLYKIPCKTQQDANILLLLLYGRAFCIHNPLQIQPSVEFNGKIFRMGQFCITQKHMSNGFFMVFVSRWPTRCLLTLMAQLNALISLPQQVAGLIWKRSEPFLEKLSSGLNKHIKLYCFVENASDFE